MHSLAHSAAPATFWSLLHGRSQAVHVIASITIITKQQLVLLYYTNFKSITVISEVHVHIIAYDSTHSNKAKNSSSPMTRYTLCVGGVWIIAYVIV